MGNVRTVPTKVELTYSVTVDITERELDAALADPEGEAMEALKDKVLRGVSEGGAVVIPHDWELVDVDIIGRRLSYE